HHLALSGNHGLPCATCHFKGTHLTPTVTCGDCHERKHGGTRSPCTTCHVVEKWKTVSFKHTYDPALLPGKHRTATCLGCHPAFRFKGSSTQCESCHRQPHEDLGACRRCHTPLSWKAVSPDQRMAEVARPTESPAPSPPPESATPSSGFRVTS